MVGRSSSGHSFELMAKRPSRPKSLPMVTHALGHGSRARVAKCRAGDDRSRRFLCDEMLSGLARWLRIAGYDTATVEPGLPDRLVLARAIAERRTMLTGDRRILHMRGSRGCVLVLSSNGVDACARELTDQLGLDWHFDPFSRCVLCNLRLESAGDNERARLPPAVGRLARLSQTRERHTRAEFRVVVG